MSVKSWLVVLVVLTMALVSCGGGDPSSDATGSPDSTSSGSGGDGAAEDGTSSEDQASVEEADVAAEEGGERSAVITIDGDSTTFDFDDITYSNVDGVDDLTFETCDPDFFGSGRFYAIGYAVDSDGELIVGDDGQPGTLTMDLPPDDWEATERDAPGFEIRLGDLDIQMATPEEAAGGTMSWSIDGSSASGTAVFIDFEDTYTVEFEVTCQGSPTVSADDLPADDPGDGDGGGLTLAGAGTGSYTVDGQSFEGVDVFRCEPFSFGGQGPHPDDVSVMGFLGGAEGLEVDLSFRQGVDLNTGAQFDQADLDVFHSRSGESGLEQFEGSATNDANGVWYVTDSETGERTELAEPPMVVEGDRITGSLAGLNQSWPDEGAATVDVTWDFEIPTEINEAC